MPKRDYVPMLYKLYFFDNQEVQIGFINDVEEEDMNYIGHKIALFRDKLTKPIEGQELLLKEEITIGNERITDISKIKVPDVIEERPIRIPGVAIYEYIDFKFIEYLDKIVEKI